MSKQKEKTQYDAEILNLEEIKDYFEAMGYLVQHLEQPWRHIIGRVKKNHRDLFFKMASTEVIGKCTRNEFIWNESIHPKIRPNNPFTIPQNENSGYYSGLFWFTFEYFEGAFLARKFPPDKKNLESWLDQIADCAVWINKLPLVELPLDHDRKGKDVAQILLENSIEWAREIPIKVGSLLKLIENALGDLQIQTQHGDFVPWHMINLGNGKFGLIDGEHARSTLPKYYDVAYLYMRVMTSLKEPKIAQQFLDKFYRRLSQAERETFIDELRPVLAQRTVGAFWDATRNPSFQNEDLSLCQLLKDKVVAGELI